jgi:nucleotide-binding universal stress UspA family protein
MTMTNSKDPNSSKSAPENTTQARYLVAYDMSESSQAALDVGIRLALSHRAELHLVHVNRRVIPTDLQSPALATATAEPSTTDLYESISRHSADRIQRAGLASVPLHLKQGDPAHEIVELAGLLPAELVIVGTKPKGGVERFFFGSVAERVIREAPCPVLVAREREAQYPQIEPPIAGADPTLGKRHTYRQRDRNIEQHPNPPLFVPMR